MINFWPITGIEVIKLVITVAAQKLICPHGRTYPKKAVKIIKTNRAIPVNQTFGKYKYDR